MLSSISSSDMKKNAQPSFGRISAAKSVKYYGKELIRETLTNYTKVYELDKISDGLNIKFFMHKVRNGFRVVDRNLRIKVSEERTLNKLFPKKEIYKIDEKNIMESVQKAVHTFREKMTKNRIETFRDELY